MAEKEEKLKSLTARIKANSHARDEPGEEGGDYPLSSIFYWLISVRKVKIVAGTARKPGRRSAGVKQSGFVRTLERPHSGCELGVEEMSMVTFDIFNSTTFEENNENGKRKVAL